MKLGFTGTRQGLSEAQVEKLTIILKEMKPTEFHHGDCIGADGRGSRFRHSIWESLDG